MSKENQDISTISGMNPSDPFWADSPSILIRRDRWDEFFPAPNHTWAETLNAIVRGASIMALAISLYRGDTAYLYWIIIALVITYLLYRYPTPISEQLRKAPTWLSSLQSNMENTGDHWVIDFLRNKKDETTKDMAAQNEEKLKEQFLSNPEENAWRTSPVRPTKDNPFMNHNLFTDPSDRPAAPLSYQSPTLQTDIEDKFGYNLYRDVSDLYNKQHNQREYYTMPSTTLPNDQTAFARWCYQSPPTCKEETIRCTSFDQRPISTDSSSTFFPVPSVPRQTDALI